MIQININKDNWSFYLFYVSQRPFKNVLDAKQLPPRFCLQISPHLFPD